MERESKKRKKSKNFTTHGSIEKFQTSWNFTSEHSVPNTLPGINKTQNTQTNTEITTEQIDALINRINNKFIPGNKNTNISDKDIYLQQLQNLFITISEEKSSFFITLKNYLILIALIIFPSKKLASMLVNTNK